MTRATVDETQPPRGDAATRQVADAAARRRRSLAMLLMVVSSVGISFGGLVLRSMETTDAWQINFFRSVALVAAIALIMGVRRRGDAFRAVRRIGLPGFFGGALLALAGVSFLQAITHTTVANTLFTMSAIPFITAALAWVFLGETPTRATLVAMAVAMLGVGVMMLDGLEGGSSYGNLMALATAVCFSGFATIVRRHRHVDMLPTLIVSGLLIMGAAALWKAGRFDLSLHDILLCFLLGGVLSGVCNALFIEASRHLAAAELTLFMLLEFALGPLWVWLFINETPTQFTVVGGGVVILAVATRALIERRGAAGPLLKRGRPSPL